MHAEVAARSIVDPFRFSLSKEANDVLPLTAHLLGETAAHAQLLANKTRDAVVSGELEQALFDGGFDHPLYGIELISMHIEGNRVAPQYYPVRQFRQDPQELPDAVFAGDYEEINVTVMDGREFEDFVKGNHGGGEAGRPVLIGAVAAGVAALAAVAAALVCFVRRRHGRETSSSGPAAAGSVRTSISAAADAVDTMAGKLRKSIDSAISAANGSVVGIGSSDVQLALTSGGSQRTSGRPPNRQPHQRMPSDVMVGAGLLAFQDSYTPTATPGHSRAGSYLPEGNFMEKVLAAAVAETEATPPSSSVAAPVEVAVFSSARPLRVSPSNTYLLGIGEDEGVSEGDKPNEE
jgi:hypothetical protein